MRKENEFTVLGFIVWGICGLFFLYEFLLRTVVGTFQHPIMYDLDLTSFKFSILSSSMYLFIYGLMQVPVGLIVDNIGLKKSLTIACLICSLSVIGFAFSYSYTSAVIFRMLTGLGSSFGFICLLFAVFNWMPHKYSALFIGLSQLVGTMGPMLAAGPLDSISESSTVDWRSIFNGLGIIGLILTVVILLLVRNKKNREGDYIILKKANKLRSSLMSLFSRLQPWYIAIFSALVYFAIEYLSENEGKSFIITKGYSSNSASYLITLSWLGYAIGCPTLGFLSDFFRRRKPVMLLASLLCSIAMISITFSYNKTLIMIAFFLLGIGASGQTIGFAIMAEQFKKSYVAIGLSLNNALIATVSAVNAPIIGGLIDFAKEGPTFKHEDYYIAFSVLICMALASTIFPLFLIKETYGKSSVEFTYLNRATKQT